MKLARRISAILAIALLASGASACETIDDLFDPGEEVQGVIEAINGSVLTVGGVAYTLNGNTQFGGGLRGPADLHVGLEVEIEYENQNGQRIVLEIERADADDD